MAKNLHHVVMCSHSADTFITFLTDVVGMDVQSQFAIPGEVLETTLGWPPSDGAMLTMLGSGDAGLIEVLDVPEKLRDTAPEGLTALSFLADDYTACGRKPARWSATSRSSSMTFGGEPVHLHHGRCADGIHGRLRH